MATINDVAKRAGVSPATVSRCLNGYPGVHPDTLERVLRAVREVGYQPNYVARSLVSNRTNLIGVVVPDISVPFVAETVRAIEDAASYSGYNITLCSTDWDVQKETRALRVMMSRRVDGVILFPAEIDPHLKFLHQYEIPTVIMARYSPEFDSVETDNRKAGWLVAKHFVDIGHVHLIFIGNRKSPKYIGFRQGALQSHIPAENVILWELESNSGPIEEGYRLTLSGMKELGLTSAAIFAKNDLVAAGALKALEDLGLRVPDDVAVAGFDNSVVSSVTRPTLTTVVQPTIELGRVSMERLLNRIAGGGGLEPQHIVMDPRLVVRDSTVNRQVTVAPMKRKAESQ